MPSEDKTKQVSGDPFLASLDAQISALQGLREAYLKVRSVGGLGQPGDVTVALTGVGAASGVGSMTANAMPTELPVGAFLNKSLPAAITLYLSAIKKKQTIREIATALREGGVESTASNFEGPVNGALYRLKAAGEVLKFKDGWALAEFYPESLRNRIAKDAEPKKRAKAKKAAKKAAAKKVARPESKAEKQKDPAQPGLEQRVSTYLATRGSEYTTVQELVAQLKVAAPVLNLTLGKMVKAIKIERHTDGRVRLTKKAA